MAGRAINIGHRSLETSEHGDRLINRTQLRKLADHLLGDNHNQIIGIGVAAVVEVVSSRIALRVIAGSGSHAARESFNFSSRFSFELWMTDRRRHIGRLNQVQRRTRRIRLKGRRNMRMGTTRRYLRASCYKTVDAEPSRIIGVRSSIMETSHAARDAESRAGSDKIACTSRRSNSQDCTRTCGRGHRWTSRGKSHCEPIVANLSHTLLNCRLARLSFSRVLSVGSLNTPSLTSEVP